MRHPAPRSAALIAAALAAVVAASMGGCARTGDVGRAEERASAKDPVAGDAAAARPAPLPARGSYALVYSGPVAAEDAPEAAAAVAEQVGLPVRYVSDLAELPGLLPDAAVFIVGGTEDDLGPLISSFTPQVTTALEDYLDGGGRYLGICGGGFLASTGWEEGDGFVDMLDLVPAESGDYLEDPDPCVVAVDWQGRTTQMYFQGGPTFDVEPGAEDVRVIARYADGQVAALMCARGAGKVAVCGPHPEARESWLDEVEDPDGWTSSVPLAADLLTDLLSGGPVLP